MMMSSKAWIATAAVIAASTTASHAETKNEVRAVSFTEDGNATRVHVRGAQTPTFTVYKLERPSRVVIDMPQARLAEALRGHEGAMMLSPNTWAVSNIAAQQLDDGAVRVIVTMARPGRYDVKTDGNEVLVMVMPRDAAPKTTNPAELEAAKQQAQAAEAARAKAERSSEAANATAKQSKAEADTARAEAERLRTAAAQQTARAEAAQRAVDEAKQAAHKNAANAADVERAKQLAEKANAEAARAKAQAAKAGTEAEEARKASQLAQVQADKLRMAAEMARREALAEAAAAKADAQKARDEMAKAKTEVARAQAEAQQEVAKSRAEVEAAKRETAKTRAQLETQTASTRETEAKARAALAAAQSREDAARSAAMQANKEKELAEAAAKRAQVARDSAASADKQKLVAEANAAEARLAKARQATDEAEIRRKTAEQLATAARQDLEQTKTALQTVEQQRAAAAAAASDASRKRMEAETAATDASRKRTQEELAANEASRKRSEAELAANEAARKRTAAETAVRAADEQRTAAESAARAADKQRTVAEAAAREAMAAKRDAEGSLAQLTKKRDAAERAAADVAVRTKAEATAQAQMDAAKARKASEDEIAAARREVAKLTEERKRAEADLAARRIAVAQQQTEAARLETEAAAARDAASREEARRTQLARQRETEERELAKLKSQKAEAQVAQSRQQTEAARLAAEAATARDAAAREEARRTQLAQQRATEERELAKLEAKRVQAQVAQTPQRSVPPPKPATATLASVNNVTFKANDAGGVVELAVTGDANIELGEITSKHVELIVDGADLAQKLERTLDVSKFGSAVKKVSTFRDRRTANRVRLIAELGSPAIPTVVRDGNTVRWRFASTTVAKRAPKTTNIPPTVVGGFGAASTPVAQQSVAQLPGAGNRRRTYYGATVEFDFKDAPIHDLLRIIADTGGVNIVVPDSIDAKVTVRLKRVPWDQALEVILASHGLWYRREGNMYRIAPRKELDAEDEAEAARRAAMVAAEQPKPEVVTLNYADAGELRSKLEGMLSPKGKIEVDGRTNALIINDVAGARENIARLALSLDIQTPQITIEARIVEARSTFVRQFGIQWGGRALAGAAGGNATGLIFPSSIGLVGANSDAQTPTQGITALPSDFAINLPAATGTGEGGAIGLSLGSVGGNFNLNLRLSALEDTGTVRIVSAPKITVINNKTALIRQGVSIPISVVSAAGTQTQFVQADLKLEVTPYVSQRDCVIAMNLDVSKNEPDFVNVGARGDPTILRKEARTTMLVADGETTVLGGIYTRNSGLAYKKVPFFGDLPVIGWFFKNRRENDDRTEILVFITPKITNKASLRCVQ